MKTVLGMTAAAVLLLALIGCASAPPEPAEPRPPGSGTVEISITGFANEDGQVLVAVFLDPTGWPDDSSAAFASEVVAVNGSEAALVVSNVPAGPFAVSVIHDEDSDRELDTGALGIPSEAYGFSADARSPFGPPGFEEAGLDLADGETKQITIRVK